MYVVFNFVDSLACVRDQLYKCLSLFLRYKCLLCYNYTLCQVCFIYIMGASRMTALHSHDSPSLVALQTCLL